MQVQQLIADLFNGKAPDRGIKPHGMWLHGWSSQAHFPEGGLQAVGKVRDIFEDGLHKPTSQEDGLHAPMEAGNFKDGLHKPTFHVDGLQAPAGLRFDSSSTWPAPPTL